MGSAKPAPGKTNDEGKIIKTILENNVNNKLMPF
jgi:hypothetical protein